MVTRKKNVRNFQGNRNQRRSRRIHDNAEYKRKRKLSRCKHEKIISLNLKGNPKEFLKCVIRKIIKHSVRPLK